MTTGKTLLLVFGVMALVIISVVLGLWALLHLAGRFEDKPRQEAKTAEGREFGKTTDQRGCLEEGLRRGKNSKLLEINEGLDNQLFVEGCLKSSRPVTDFCKGVPKWWNIKDTDWKQEQCEKVRQSALGSGCMSVFDAQMDYCNGR